MNALEQQRRGKDSFFKHSPDSPLAREAQATFQGLAYYPENQALRLVVPVEEFTPKEIITMATSTGSVREFERWGRFRFEIDGAAAALTIYYNDEGGFFVPFMDGTTGQETYAAGRYLEIEPLPNGKFLADFNQAYNPWCAYSPDYSCPIPPAENRLQVPIRAGEQDFHAS